MRTMLLSKSVVCSASRRGFVSLLKQTNPRVNSPASYSLVSSGPQTNQSPATIRCNDQLKRLIHLTRVNRDLEAGLRALGAGVAAAGVTGSGIGLGLIFGNLVNAVARNPSISKQIFANAIMGAAFCESIGLFAMTISFIIMA